VSTCTTKTKTKLKLGFVLGSFGFWRCLLFLKTKFYVSFSLVLFRFYARKQLLFSARVLAIAILSVYPSITGVDQSKTVQTKITKSLSSLQERL